MPSDIQALLDGLGSFAGFTQALSAHGQLGQRLPLVDLSPGGPDGLAFAPTGTEKGLVEEAIVQTLTDEANAADTASGTVVIGDLGSTDKAVNFTDGTSRSGTLTVVPSGSAGSQEQLDITLDLSRTVENQPLDVVGTAGGQQVSVTSGNGVEVTLTTHIHFVAVVVKESGSSYYFYVVHDGSGPTFTVSGDATIPTPGDVDAAIGILGVTLSAADFHSTERLTASIDDPNNDGELAFANADGSTGELAQPGAQTGLLHVGFASPAGSVTNEVGNGPASFTVETADTTLVSGLPAVQTTITASWPDVSTGSAELGADAGLAAADDFLNLTPKDLADGLDHLANTITAIQRARWSSGGATVGNIDLPYMKGTLADAIDASAALDGFVAETTFNPANPIGADKSNDPAKNGQPTFSSLQELVADLEAFATSPPGAPSVPTGAPTFEPLAGDATITVGTIHFDDGTSLANKVLIPLTIQTPAGSPVNLDAVPILASGKDNATYGTNTVTDATPGLTFPSSLAGQTVQVDDAGTNVSGIIDHVSGDTLALKAQTQIASDAYWVSGGQSVSPPPSGSAYEVVGSDPQTGALEFGDTFSSVGITKANADATSATVTASSTLQLGLVLDLEPPNSGPECNSSIAAEFPQYPELQTATACPFQHLNPDGSTTTITQVPTNTDRIMLRTGGGGDLLTADFPITSEAPADLAAKVGYLNVHLSGQLELAAPSTGHMLTIDLKPQTTADGSGDVTLDQLTRGLVASGTSDASSLLTETVRGRVEVNLSVDVPLSSDSPTLPSAPSFFGATNLPSMTIEWTDFGSTAPPAPTTDPRLDELTAFDFDSTNPTSLVAPLAKSLENLDASVGSLGSVPSLDTKVPVLGRSLGSLLSAQDSGGGPNVVYGTDSAGDGTLTDSARPFDANLDPKLHGHTMTVGTEHMTIDGVSAASGGTEFTFTTSYGTQPADGTPYVLTSPLADAIAGLAAQPPPTLQDFLTGLTAAVGGDAAGHPSAATIGIDTSGSTPALVVYLDWRRTSRTESTLALPFTTDCTAGPCPTATIIAAQTSDPIVADVTVDSNVGLEVPLRSGAPPADPSVTGGSTIGGDLSVSFDGAGSPAGTIGQLGVNLGHGPDQVQLRAGYHVAVGGGSSGTQALSALVAQAPTVTAPGVDCPKGSFTGQALCAVIPVYDQPNGAVGPVDVHIPAVASDPLSATGRIDPGTKTLGDDVINADKVIAFTGLTDAFNHYFDLAQQGLQKASFGGRLPLVGHDLQAGSDFIGTLKTDFGTAVTSFTANVGSTAGDLQANLQTALDDALPGPTVKVTVACKLPPVSGVHAVATTDGNSPQSWYYEVLGYKKVNGTPYVTLPGAADDNPVTNDTSLDPTNNYNTISWTSDSADYDGYLILESKDASSWVQIADVPGTQDHYVDPTTGQTSTTYAPPTSQPTLGTCPTDVAIANVTRVTAEVKAGDTATASVPFDIGVPGLSLSSTAGTPGLSASARWSLDLTFGVDRKTGFFVKSGTPLSVDAEVQSPADPFQAQIAFLTVRLTDKNSGLTCGVDNGLGSNACISASINIAKDLSASDLANPGELASAVSASISGGVNLDWGFEIDPTLPDAQQLLPGITGDFVLKWDPSFSTAGGDMKAGDLEIAFDGVSVDAHGFLTGVLGPIIKQVKSITDPIQPVIDTLTAPIPVLSDLSHLAGGGDVTLLSMAEAFNTLAGGPDLSMIDTVTHITSLFKQLSQIDCSSSCSILIGDFDVSGASGGDPQTLLDNQSTPAAGPSLDTLVGGSANLPSAPDLGSALNAKAGAGATLFTAGSDNQVSLNDNCAPSAANGSSATEEAGVTFPVVQHPLSIFGLLFGRDIAIACFDSGFLKIGFSYSQAFGPVYAPPPVLLTISGSASASLHLVGGFDTYGMRTAVQNIANGTFNSATPLQFLDSLFLTTTDANGKPLPVVTLTGKLAAGAEVSAVVISVGVQGGVQLSVNFTWHDPDNDGKFRFDEFLVTAVQNPLCLFNVSGALSVFLELDITIGFSPFDYTFSITLVNVRLLDFSIQPDCTPPPPTVGAVDSSSNTLLVYAGDLGTDTLPGSKNLRGDSAYDNKGTADETFKITQFHDTSGAVTGYAVDALGVHDNFPKTVATVYVDGKGYGGNLTIVMQGALDPSDAVRAQPGPGQQQAAQKYPFTANAIVYGGTGDDTINTGQGNSFVDGGGGNDHITTADLSDADGTALVSGNAGNDQIRVGNADDLVIGDTPLGTPSSRSWSGASIPDWTVAPSAPSQAALTAAGDGGNDVINVGLGKTTAWGNGGDDTLTVTPDNPAAATDPALHSQGATLIGGNGSDRIAGGNGNDTIYTGVDQTRTTDNGTPTDSGGADACTSTDTSTVQCPGGLPVNVVDTGGGVDPGTGKVTGGGDDHVYGGTGIDLVAGHSAPNQTDTIYGGAGDDVLAGGFGTDEIYGGPGDDYVLAEPSKVGNAGPDDVIGGVDFGPHRDVTHLALPGGVDPSPKLLVGGAGNDHIDGGAGGATIYGDSSTESVCPTASPPPAGATAPSETGQAQPPDGNDLITGGSGTDIVQAGGGDDYVDTGTGNDFACGGQGNDTLVGHSLATQTDTFYGGSGNDVEVGGGGGDYLFGNAGNDTVYGGNGNDTIEGNDDQDVLFGGAGNDLIVGGTTAAAQPDAGAAGTNQGDLLSGDSGDDVLIGDNGAQLAGGEADIRTPGVIVGDPVVAYDLADGNGQFLPHGANDVIFGGGGDDVAYGGLGNDVVSGGDGADLLEGNDGTDTVSGGAGQDDVIGGSSQIASGATGDQSAVGYPDLGDVLYGGDGGDVVLGDNGAISRSGAPGFDPSDTYLTDGRGLSPRTVLRYDLGDTPTAGTSGNDFISGDNGPDVLLGQGGDDRVLGGAGNDYLEGGSGTDWLQGDAGDDDLVGGTSVPESGTGDQAVGQPDAGDALLGGTGDDTIAGDNARITIVASGQPVPRVFQRLGSTGQLMRARSVALFDLHNTGTATSPDYLTTPDATRFGADQIDGGAGNDVVYGQDGNDAITGGLGDDYIEGNGGADTIKGDVALDSATDGTMVPWVQDPGWAGNPDGLQVPGYTPPDPDSLEGPDTTTCTQAGTVQCQDDLIGGSSIQAFRDAGDTIEGDYGDDFQLGDNGTLVRDVTTLADGHLAEATLDQRQPGTTVLRHHDDTVAGLTSTRFCTTTQATCEPVGAFGDDTLYGGAGNDDMWGQDGNDAMYGGLGNDDMYGGLGNDTMGGGPGQDVMLGDRGGAVDTYYGDSSHQFSVTLSGVPRETYTAFASGTYNRQVDLLHDVDGASFVGSSTSAPMPHAGTTEGGNDIMMGGPGHDTMHGGAGDDVMNGDAGGDIVFGDDGADVIYGGQGCDLQASAANQDLTDACPLVNGLPDPTARGANDKWVDYEFGGKGGTDATSQAGDLGADLLDVAPRGTFAGCTGNPWPVVDPDGTIHDPCTWWDITNRTSADPASHQDHQGTDWMYGGWGRDVMQSDVAQNGPNPGDRAIDWTGAYNLYTACNSAYGGYNDIRQFSPSMQKFLQGWAWGSGAGQSSADVSTSSTSAFDELALTYPSDIKGHGSGSAFPSTPGHFDQPSCAQ